MYFKADVRFCCHLLAAASPFDVITRAGASLNIANLCKQA